MRREQRLQTSRRSQGETGSKREGVEQKSKRRSKQEPRRRRSMSRRGCRQRGRPKVAEDSALLDQPAGKLQLVYQSQRFEFLKCPFRRRIRGLRDCRPATRSFGYGFGWLRKCICSKLRWRSRCPCLSCLLPPFVFFFCAQRQIDQASPLTARAGSRM